MAQGGSPEGPGGGGGIWGCIILSTQTSVSLLRCVCLSKTDVQSICWSLFGASVDISRARYTHGSLVSISGFLRCANSGGFLAGGGGGGAY